LKASDASSGAKVTAVRGHQLEALAAEVDMFLTSQIGAGAFVPSCDSWVACHDPQFSAELGRRGWIGMTWPVEYGGHGRSEVERLVVTERLLASGAPVAAHWGTDRQVGPMLLRYGSEQLRQRFLPAAAQGKIFFSTALSEPDTGSDLASVSTHARHYGQRLRLTGHKTWVSHADQSDYIVVLCRTSTEADRHAGLTQLIVPQDADGLDVRPIAKMTGDTAFCDVYFDDVLVPENLVLGRIGNGWHQISDELSIERMGPERFMSSAVLLLRLLAEADHLAMSSRERLGELLSRFLALRAAAIRAATGHAGQHIDGSTSAAFKFAGTRFDQDVIENARLIIRAERTLTHNPELKRLLRQGALAAPTFTLRGGTTEILSTVIARGLGIR
jgi:acyl-CoA dehydrogenase